LYFATRREIILEISVIKTEFSSMERGRYLFYISSCFEFQPVVALLGPRQCGKTDLGTPVR
jgi:predicted AAA+ superfamily ATPase